MVFKQFPYPTYRRLRHILVVWAIETIAILLLDQWLDGLVLDSSETAALAIAVIGLMNAIFRPILLSLTITITVITFGLLSFLLNVAVVLLAAYILPGFIVSDPLTAIWIVLGVTLINLFVSDILSLDENDSYYRSVILQMQSRNKKENIEQDKGLVIIEIDGLAKDILQHAIDDGYMPTLETWIKKGNHRLYAWNCGLPSQTSAIQSTILYGNNPGIPAFRWYEKENNRLVVSNHLYDTADLEKRFETEDSLLKGNASSIGNMFSGGAKKSVMTMSEITQVRSLPKRSGHFYNFFLNPYNFTRTFFLMLLEFFREIFQSLYQRFSSDQPHLHRNLLFAVERTISSVLLRELTTHILIEDLFKGYQTIYATYVGYDVVAHQAGPSSPSAMSVLRSLDKQLQRIEYASKFTNRKYEFILISDHGQSQGWTFKQKFGQTLESLINDVLQNKYTVSDAGDSEERKGYVNTLLTEALRPHFRMQQTAKRLYAQMKQPGEEYQYFDFPTQQNKYTKTDIVVCTSGNLGLVYFTNIKTRLTFEEIIVQYPGFLETMASHPGIGLILVNSSFHGAIVFSAKGINYLEKGYVEGLDPLTDYEPYAREHLLELNSFQHTGDLVIISKYDPSTRETSAFEELIGHHGGLGGLQTQPFLLIPASFSISEPITNAKEMHNALKEWQKQLQGKKKEGLIISS